MPGRVVADQGLRPVVGTTQLGGETVRYCEVCSLAYKERPDAEACGAWCRTHETCSLKIGQRAVGSVEPDRVQSA